MPDTAPTHIAWTWSGIVVVGWLLASHPDAGHSGEVFLSTTNRLHSTWRLKSIHRIRDADEVKP